MNNEANTRERPLTAMRKAELLEKIDNYLDVHLEERITLQQVAAYFHVSVSTVTQLFQRKAGTTFHQFLTRKRMKAAEELIREGVPLEVVGKRVGYTDHSSFYRAFKQIYGVAPRDFRRGKEES